MASSAPVPDRAERDAFFPSDSSLEQYVPPQAGIDVPDHEQVASGPRRVLVIGTDERYLRLADGRYFSTGNHPVETLGPIMHLRAAGYEFEVATPSGAMVKLEHWAVPAEDEAVKAALDELMPQLRDPRPLDEVVAELDPARYAAVFVPGGHGAMIGLPTSAGVGAALRWALEHDRPVITLCHGPAALLAATDDQGRSLFAGYEACVFPDALDSGANIDLGYLPGAMSWLLAERLAEQGVTVVNDDMSGQVHRDRLLVTGDSPLAADALGRLAVETLAELG